MGVDSHDAAPSARIAPAVASPMGVGGACTEDIDAHSLVDVNNSVQMRNAYRRRFESSVMGHHLVLPPADLALRHPLESEAAGAGTHLAPKDPNPIPFRFTTAAIPQYVDAQTAKLHKPKNPQYSTSANEIGGHPVDFAELPLEWHGSKSHFTKWHRVQSEGTPGIDPTSSGNSSLNTAIDRSYMYR